MTTKIIDIESLGAQGDGIADVDGRAVYVPMALPGERVEVKIDGDRANITDIIVASNDRIEPVCAHFSTCGGCVAQHLASASYSDWKRGLVTSALAHRGLDIPVLAPIVSPPASRRRAKVNIHHAARGMMVGFAERRSNHIVDITECQVLRPELVAAMALLRQQLAAMVKGAAAATLTLTDGGVDVVLEGVKAKTRERLEALADVAEKGNLARLSTPDDIIVERRAPLVRFDDIAVLLPPGAFLQATREGEAALINFVADAVAKSARVVDLFSGIGTFALSLPQAQSVHGVESDAPSVAALQAAARRSGRQITVERRDLFRNPLMALELKKFDVAIVDPPRVGARAQIEMLAASQIPSVVMISCNPATFARDARTLVDAGFSAECVQPVDQFLWSPHLELSATFRR